MKILKINESILGDSFSTTLPFNEHTSSNPGKEISFEIFFRNQSAIETAKYPFLSKTQIKQRIADMWKKKQVSKSKAIKNGSRSKINSKEKEDEHCGPQKKVSSKRSLVPLKVDFLSPVGALKRKPTANGKKRRVSFNKELYIRYRTTSEESNNSSLKDKKHKQHENKTPIFLKDSSKDYNSSTDYKPGTHKSKKSQMDEQFDELLNKNCSWSYRSQVTRKSNTMEKYPDSVQIQSTFRAVIQKMPEKVMTEDESLGNVNEGELDAISSENEFLGSPEDTHNKSSKLQKETGLLKKRPKPISEEKLIPEATSTPIFEKTFWKRQIQTKSNKNPSGSSSEDEIFQTRLSVKNKNEQYSNWNMPISPTKHSEKESTVENHSNYKNNFPVIIQAIPYDKSNANTHSDKTIEKCEIKQPEMNNDLEQLEMDGIDNGDILSLGANEMVNSGIQNTVENDNAQLKVKEKKCNENKDRKGPSWEFMENITAVSENDSLEYEESIIAASDDFIIQDFLNGSLNLSIYRSDRQPSKNTPKATLSNMQSENFNLHTKETNATVSKNNKFKRGSNNIFNGNNLKKKSNYFDISPLDTSNKTSKRKQTSKELVKSTKKPRITANKRNAKTINKKLKDSTDFLFNSKLENMFSEKTKQKKKLNNQLLKYDEDLTSLNKFNTKNEDASSKSSVRNKTKRTIEDKEVLDSQFYNKNLAQHFGRNTRNSSLIAKRKIKEMEQLECSESCEENCLDFEDETHELKLDNVNSKASKQTFKPEKRNKYGYQTESILSSADSFNHKSMNSDEINSNESLEIYTKEKYKVEKTQFSKNNTTLDTIRNTFYGCRMQGKSPLKKNNKRTEDKPIENTFLKSNLTLSDDYFMQDDENISKSRKKSKRDHSKEMEIMYSGKSTENKNMSRKKEEQSVLTYKGPMTRRRRRTWDMLEKELLNESDNETRLTNNISEAVILKMENLVKKQNVQNTDLHTISNTKLKTTRKPRARSKYNKQCKTNAESSQYLEPKVNKCKYLNEDAQSREIVPSCSKNSILERAIAAMERCTANLITPKVTSNENEEVENVLQFENISHYSNTSHEALIHSNITFMANENQRYYKNEIVSYLKKYTRREQSINSNRNESENLSDAEHLDENSFDAEHLEENSFEANDYLLKNNAEKMSERNQAVDCFLGGKNNPWDNLMKELDLNEGNTDGCLKAVSNSEKNTELISRPPPIQKNEKLDKYPKRKYEMTNFRKGINKQNEGTDTENEQNFKQMENEERESLIGDVFNSRNCIDNLSLNTRVRSKKDSYQNEILEPESAETNLEKSERKIKNKRASNMKTVKKSPKFKLQIIKNGNLKLKRHSSRSSTSNSSEEFTVQNLKPQNEIGSTRAKNIKAKEKYQNYLKKITLIAEKDDDVFSLSSSDSETCNQKNRGTGLLCDLFEE